MATSVYTPEIATKYGALDSNVILDGGPASAFALRQLAMSTHRLVAMGSPLLNLMFDASDDAGGSGLEPQRGVLNGYAIPNSWRKLYPGPLVCPKKSSHRKGECQIIAKISNGDTVLLQIATDGSRFRNDATASSENVMTMLGTGAWATYNITSNASFPDLKLGPYGIESIDLWMKGNLTSNLIDEAVYGPNNTGTASTINQYSSGNTCVDITSNWNFGSGTRIDNGSVVVVFDNGSLANELLAAPRNVSRLIGGAAFFFTQGLTLEEAHLLDGSTYRLLQTASYQIGSVTVRTADLTGMGG